MDISSIVPWNRKDFDTQPDYTAHNGFIGSRQSRYHTNNKETKTDLPHNNKKKVFFFNISNGQMVNSNL